MPAIMYAALAAVILLGKVTVEATVSPAANRFCANIGDTLHSDLEEHAATVFCSSYLDIPLHTMTASTTQTIKKFTIVDAAAHKHPRAETTTRTDTVYVFPSDTVTKTLYTSTSTIYSPLTGCASPTSLQKRLAAGQSPAAFSKLPSSSVSDACDCLSIMPSTKTVAVGTTTEVVEVPRSHQKRAITTISETVTGSGPPLTRTATSDHYTTTVTVTAVSPFKLLDASSKQWAYINGYSMDHLGVIDFNQAEDSATEWALTESGLLYHEQNPLLGYGSSGRSFSMFVADHVEPISTVPCKITTDSNGYCGLECTGSGYDVNVLNIEEPGYPQWFLAGEHPSAAYEKFPLYVVGVTA